MTTTDSICDQWHYTFWFDSTVYKQLHLVKKVSKDKMCSSVTLGFSYSRSQLKFMSYAVALKKYVHVVELYYFFSFVIKYYKLVIINEDESHYVISAMTTQQLE